MNDPTWIENMRAGLSETKETSPRVLPGDLIVWTHRNDYHVSGWLVLSVINQSRITMLCLWSNYGNDPVGKIDHLDWSRVVWNSYERERWTLFPPEDAERSNNERFSESSAGSEG